MNVIRLSEQDQAEYILMRISWISCQVNRIYCALTTMCIYTIQSKKASTYFEKMAKLGRILRNDFVLSFGNIILLSEHRILIGENRCGFFFALQACVSSQVNYAVSMYRFATARSLFHFDPARKGPSGFLTHNDLAGLQLLNARLSATGLFERREIRTRQINMSCSTCASDIQGVADRHSTIFADGT
jgi:hypothetical protein